jgi:hypothetical protein
MMAFFSIIFLDLSDQHLHETIVHRAKNCNSSTGDNGGFRTLAKYIGVFGTPENEGNTDIAMTAPVVMEQGRTQPKQAGGPTSIAMTAPVVIETNVTPQGMKKMMFMLPSEYDDIAKIPKPTNPAVHIEMIPSEFGAVRRYNGDYNVKINSKMAQELGEQLLSDGLVDITQDYVMEHFQFWGYNPPFTIPYLRRNEVWIKLNKDQVHFLKETFPSQTLPSGTKTMKMTKTTMISLGLCGFSVSQSVIKENSNRMLDRLRW